MALSIAVEGIKDGEEIPKRFTCDGENLSPRITISGAPEKAKALVLIMEDPDAPMGLFVHWTLFNIPPNTVEIKPGMGRERVTAEGMEQGKNDFGRTGYDGPCPPRGHGPHRYYFRLYAVDSKLSLRGTPTRKEILNAMEGKILENTYIMGKYGR